MPLQAEGSKLYGRLRRLADTLRLVDDDTVELVHTLIQIKIGLKLGIQFELEETSRRLKASDAKQVNSEVELSEWINEETRCSLRWPGKPIGAGLRCKVDIKEDIVERARAGDLVSAMADNLLSEVSRLGELRSLYEEELPELKLNRYGFLFEWWKAGKLQKICDQRESEIKLRLKRILDCPSSISRAEGYLVDPLIERLRSSWARCVELRNGPRAMTSSGEVEEVVKASNSVICVLRDLSQLIGMDTCD